MSARILASRGRSLAGSRCRSSLPGILPRRFSTNPDAQAHGGGAGEGDEPSSKRHPQSFVNHDVNPLELGELELNLPPGYHDMIHRKQRGIPKPRLDGDGKSSYWRPPFKNPRAEIISAEDFENRPRITFSESFASLHDGMTVLSWMPQADKDNMYKLYTEMMLATAAANPSGKKKGKDLTDEEWGVLSANTSHEYVIRVIAQEFNVTTSRAAGVIQLQHNEEQLKKDPTFKVNHLLQEMVDAKIRENIRGIYAEYGEKDPLGFVEEPVAATGNVERENAGSPEFLSASELTDVDALMKKTRMMELEDHRMRIRNHVYVEDVDERTRKVKVDQEAKRLMRMQEEMGALYEDFVDEKHDTEEERGEEKVSAKESTEGEGDDSPEASASDDVAAANSDEGEEKEVAAGQTKKPKKKLGVKIPPNLKIPPKPAAASPFPEGGRGYNEESNTRRPRWKYVAQIVNTHSMENPPGSKRRGRAVAKQAKGRRHGRIVDGNTIVEVGGKLRAASVAELENTSWKHVRNESEFIFKGVKQAWLRRQLEGEVDGWGPQEEVLPPYRKSIKSGNTYKGNNHKGMASAGGGGGGGRAYKRG
ncbi:hypothetical protein ACHAXT_010336 [Thalassiosira profunda]